MDGQARRDEQWQMAEDAVVDELARLRQLALTADSFDEMEEAVAEMGQRLQQILLGAAEDNVNRWVPQVLVLTAGGRWRTKG